MTPMTAVTATTPAAPSFFSAAYWSAIAAKVKTAVSGVLGWTANMWATSLAFKAIVILGTAALIGLALYALLAKSGSSAKDSGDQGIGTVVASSRQSHHHTHDS